MLNPRAINPNEPIKKYATPKLIGLNNIESSDFMNSILQCLSQTESLTKYFLNENTKKKIYNNIAKLNTTKFNYHQFI